MPATLRLRSGRLRALNAYYWVNSSTLTPAYVADVETLSKCGGTLLTSTTYGGIPHLHYSEIRVLAHLGSVLGAPSADDVLNQDDRWREMAVTRAAGDKPPSYRSYLLRLWRESEYGAWRASLESVTTGERQGFPDLPSLLAYLQDECQALADYHQDVAKHQTSDEV